MPPLATCSAQDAAARPPIILATHFERVLSLVLTNPVKVEYLHGTGRVSVPHLALVLLCVRCFHPKINLPKESSNYQQWLCW